MSKSKKKEEKKVSSKAASKNPRIPVTLEYSCEGPDRDWAKFPEAIGTICLSPGMGFNAKFLQECLWRDLNAVINTNGFLNTNDDLTNNAIELKKMIVDPDVVVISTDNVLPLVIQHAEYAEDFVEDVDDLHADGNPITVAVESRKLDSPDPVYTTVSPAYYIIRLPEWSHHHISFTVTDGINENSPDIIVTFRVKGDRIYGDGFTNSIEKWWRRLMLACEVEDAVCYIRDYKNSRVLTDLDKDTEFIKHIPLPDAFYKDCDRW